jgi:hypothetical protein
MSMFMFITFGLILITTLLHLAKISLRYFTFRYYYNEVVTAAPTQYSFDVLIQDEKNRFEDEWRDGTPVICILAIVSIGSYLNTLPLDFLFL